MGMMHRHLRTIAVLIAVVGIVFAVYQHEHSYRTSHGLPIDVLVAKRTIQKGTTGTAIRDAVLYQVAVVGKAQIENGAILDPSMLVGKVATEDINPGQQLTVADFASAAQGSLGPPYQRALIIKPTSSRQIGRQITAGSHVDVWVATARHGSNTNSRPVLRRLYGNMEVLNVNTSNGTVALLATPQQAGRLIFVSGKANDRLVLRLHRTTTS